MGVFAAFGVIPMDGLASTLKSLSLLWSGNTQILELLCVSSTCNELDETQLLNYTYRECESVHGLCLRLERGIHGNGQTTR